VEGLWERAIQRSICGVPVRILCPEDQLVHLCAHLHAHNYERLGWLSDLALLVRDFGAQLDWSSVLNTVRIEELQVDVYYSLHVLDRLLGVSVPQDVLWASRPDFLRRSAHERLMPMDKVLSLQPVPDFYYSFYKEPVFHRVLPALLVMGRRSEKLYYLFRSFVLPPRDWLRYHYSLDADADLWAYYLLHPFRFLRLVAHRTRES
jgi:hypothetical protein